MQRGRSDGGEFVSGELIVVVEAEGDAGGGGLEGFGVDVLDGGDEDVGLVRVFLWITAAIEEEIDLRLATACRKLFGNEFVDLPELRVGGMAGSGFAAGSDKGKRCEERNYSCAREGPRWVSMGRE